VTDQELKELVASLAVAQKETDLRQKETERLVQETSLQLKQTDRAVAEFRQSQLKGNEELRQVIKELKTQIGGLGNKFGEFSEGMPIPSLIEILAKQFGAEQIIEPKQVRKGADEIELDLVGASNGGAKLVVAAEVKSVLNVRELKKFLRNLSRFFEFFPQFKGYKLYGVLAAVQSSKEMDRAAVAQGISLARMHGDIFRLKVPAGFHPKDFAAKTS
jgi:hypothetical protein